MKSSVSNPICFRPHPAFAAGLERATLDNPFIWECCYYFVEESLIYCRPFDSTVRTECGFVDEEGVVYMYEKD